MLYLQIAMDDSALVQVANGIDDGTDDVSGFVFSVDFLFGNLIV